jgi:hypothetical protein
MILAVNSGIQSRRMKILILFLALLSFLLLNTVAFFHGYTKCQTKASNCKRNYKTSLHMSARVPLVPYYLNKHNKRDGHMWMDIYNAMGRERILFISRQLDDESVNTLIGSLLYLQGKSAEEKITLYLNIPGGEELSESIAP